MVEKLMGPDPILHDEICQYRSVGYQGNPGQGLPFRSGRIGPQDNFQGQRAQTWYLYVGRVLSPSKRVEFTPLSRIEIAEIALIALRPQVDKDG
ncbi:MAG: hypothetical protein ACETWR_15930 [Anaerolineae bacterium]